MRYYWPDPEIEAAVHRLLDNLDRRGLPDPLLSAFLPLSTTGYAAGCSPTPPGSSSSTGSATYSATYAAATLTAPSDALSRGSGPTTRQARPSGSTVRRLPIDAQRRAEEPRRRRPRPG